MSKKYNEVMEHITVTHQMHERIMSNIEKMSLHETKQKKTLRFSSIKKLAAMAACLTIMFVSMLSLPTLLNQSDPPVSDTNSIVEVASIEELSKTVGFAITEPAVLPFESEQTIYTAYWTELAEITYMGEGQTAVFRKGVGTEDVSGEFFEFDAIDEISAGDITVTLKGNEDNYTLATWTDGHFAYSLSFSEGKSEMEWLKILQPLN